MSEPGLQKLGDSYFLTWGQGIVFEFHHLKDHSDGLSGELSITHEGFLAHWGRLTLSSALARGTAAKSALEAKPGLPWKRMVDESCHRVVLAARQGAPATPLEPKRPEPGRWLVEGIIPLGETTILFGDGGSGKSLCALGLGVCGLLGVRFGAWSVGPIRRILYLDWESSRQDHENRLWGLTEPLGRPLPEDAILYRPMTRSAAEEASELRALVAKHQVDLVICDSLGPACGPEPETAGAATGALTALRSCAPATRLVVAHVSKAEADRTQGHSRPFGSVYVYNLARSVIEARRSESTEDKEFTLTLTHTKNNNGPKRPQAAVRWLFQDEGYISIIKGDPDMARAPVATQILAFLKGGAQTAQDTAQALGLSDNQVRARLGDLEKAHKVVHLTAHSGGQHNKNLWGLADTTAQREPC